MSLCLPDTMNLKFSNPGGCCLQWGATTDMDLELVHRSQTYWNSPLVLPWYGCTTQYWFHLQFHLICQHVGGQQTFILRWLNDVPSRQCNPDTAFGQPIVMKEWTLITQACDPLYMKFEVNDMSETMCQAADDCFGPAPTCDFIAEITEKA